MVEYTLGAKMSFGQPICGREAISRALGIDPRTFTGLVKEGAVAGDGRVVSGQPVIVGLERVVREGHRSYALQPTFRLPDVKAPIHAAMPRPAHFCLVYREGSVFGTPVEVVQGRRPYVMMCEPPPLLSGSGLWEVMPVDAQMQPLPLWRRSRLRPECPLQTPPGDYLE